MKRTFLIAGLAALILALSAVTAFACIQSNPVVCAPAADETPGAEHSNNPPRQQRAELPNNQGTNNAADKSPAIENGNCGYQQP